MDDFCAALKEHLQNDGSLHSANWPPGPGMPEVLLASHIVVLEGPGCGTLEDHLAKGESFIEVAPRFKEWCHFCR